MKVFLDSVGCKLNQSEIEKYAGQFRSAGYLLVATPEEADVVIVNTCAVTTAAAQDSRQKIRHSLNLSDKRVIATGCLATLDGALDQLKNTNLEIVTNSAKDRLVEDLFDIQATTTFFDREPIPGERSRKRAFIKVQDGCDNYCTYCITRIARGKGRSVPVQLVLDDIQGAIDHGSREIILTGVHLGSWGQDLEEKLQLADLIQRILISLPADIRVRVSSLEPWDLDESFFSLWQDDRLCRHFHLPIQSGADQTLRRMGRQITTQRYAEIVDQIRDRVPDAAITTDVIVGFPGETESDHQDSMRFLEEISFADGHVFTYSSREGTPAAKYPGQINGVVKRQRSKQMHELFERMRLIFLRQQVGKIQTVLWEDSDRLSDQGFFLNGWSGNYIRVFAESKTLMVNQFSRVKIREVSADGNCLGDLIAPEMPGLH